MKNEILLVHSTRQLSAITFKSKRGVKMNNSAFATDFPTTWLHSKIYCLTAGGCSSLLSKQPEALVFLYHYLFYIFVRG